LFCFCDSRCSVAPSQAYLALLFVAARLPVCLYISLPSISALCLSSTAKSLSLVLSCLVLSCQLVKGVSCSDVAFGGFSIESLGVSEADMVGLDDAHYWWKIEALSPNFGDDTATAGVVNCKVSLLAGEEDAYEFKLDFFLAPTIRYVEPPSGTPPHPT
jgi:hypothetical protein